MRVFPAFPVLPALQVLPVAVLLTLAACKKDPDPPPLSPPPLASAQVQVPGKAAGKEPHKPGFKQDKIPPELNPAKNVRGQVPVMPRRGVAALRPFAPGRTTKIGQGSLTLTLGEGPAATLPVTLYRRGQVVVLSADRPDLGIVLSVPTLVAGTYARTEAQTALPQPNLRARIGLAEKSEHLQAADQPAGSPLTVRITAGATPGSVSGTFEGQVSRDGGQVVRKVSAGSFQLQVDMSLPAAAETLAGALPPPAGPAGAAPGTGLRNVASPSAEKNEAVAPAK